MAVMGVVADTRALCEGVSLLAAIGCTGMVVRRPMPSSRPDSGVDGDCDMRRHRMERRVNAGCDGVRTASGHHHPNTRVWQAQQHSEGRLSATHQVGVVRHAREVTRKRSG